MAPPSFIDAKQARNLAEIKLEDIEFDVVAQCTDKHVLKRYITILTDDGSFYQELMQACKDKLLEVSPKDYYILYPRAPTFQEVDDITRDLLDWQESVMETDKALRDTKKKKKKNEIWDDAPGAEVNLPIRGQEPAPAARQNLHRKEEIKDQSKKQVTERDEYARDKTKMKDYYRSWDQVDVDKIEADMDKDEVDAEDARRKHFDDMRDEQDAAHKSTPVKIGNLPEVSGVPEAHRSHMADSEKEKGNEAFYAKDYEEAEAYYSRSLHFRADDPSAWANRALSRLKLENPKGALEDCEMGLAINPRYMKALHRKGKALYELQRYEEAVQCFQLALMESPGNTQINGDLMVARRRLRSPDPPPQAKSFAPPARARDARQESSCVIEEVFDDETDEIICDAPPAAAQTPSTASTAPGPGYTRVQIEEDSDSEEEQAPVQKTGFHKVQIEEDSEDSEQGEPESEPSAVVGASTGGFHKVQIVEGSDSEEEAPVATAGFHKIQIVEGSDSEEETEPAPKASALVQSKAPAPEVCIAAEAVSFDDMD